MATAVASAEPTLANATITPSPVDLTSDPPWASIAWRCTTKNVLRTASASATESDSNVAVESTRSVNISETVSTDAMARAYDGSAAVPACWSSSSSWRATSSRRNPISVSFTYAGASSPRKWPAATERARRSGK